LDRNAWAAGINAWNASPALLLYDRPTSYKVGLAEINSSSTSLDGKTTYYYLFGYFTSMSAWVNHLYLKNYTTLKANGVAAHEWGHVAGLDHTAGCVLMTPYSTTRASCGISGPVQDDIDGIKALY
jgi:predicted Zn-dependent protease